MITKTFDPLGDDLSSISLTQALATDLMVVNAARVSFGEVQDAMDDKARGLIGFLMRERHGSPFEHNMFTFHIKCPLFVAREWMRHRVGSFNEYSGRYKEMRPEFYVPQGEAVRTQTGKPGAYRFEPMAEGSEAMLADVFSENHQDAWDKYQRMLVAGCAKEVARMVLPLNLYTEFYWTVNARALMNFLSLRNHDAALLEIRRFAQDAEILFSLNMPVTAAAFTSNDRQAP